MPIRHLPHTRFARANRKRGVSGPLNVLLVFIGESNAGGDANNTDALNIEIEERANTLIWNNDTNTEFVPLKIADPGSNNINGHVGLDPDEVGLTHGWELEIANEIDFGNFGENNIYLCKCGQGGSRIDQWDEGDSYYNTFISRTTAAMADVSFDKIYVLYSQGINDAIAVTDPTTWYNATVTFFGKIRDQLGSVPIYGTKITSVNVNYDNINTQIDNLDTNLAYFTKIQTSDASEKDINHWDYQGMKLIAGRMMDLVYADLGITIDWPVAVMSDGNTAGWFDYEEKTIEETGVAIHGDKSGDRNDVFQNDTTKQPSLEVAGILYDGINDFLQSVDFPLEQPTNIYLLVKHVTWTINDRFLGGNAGNVGDLYQGGVTPNLGLYAGVVAVNNPNLVINTYEVIHLLYNGVNSFLDIGATTSGIGDAGTNDMGGITFGSTGGGTTRWANVEYKEAIIRTITDTAPNVAAIKAYLESKK